MRTVDLVWVVTYKTGPDEPQQEITRYTLEAANHFASNINKDGGIAVVTEDARNVDNPDEDEHPVKRLTWPEEEEN